MRTRFIFNPCSGKNRRGPWLAHAIRRYIEEHELEADLVFTEAPGHATQLAQAAIADGCARVVAVGGDGTMNEVAQALIGAKPALGLIPCGSGNGLALHLGIPTQPQRALALLADDSSRVVEIDTGSANGHPFFNAMGLGFDAEISWRFNRLTRRGLPAYALTGLRAFRQHRAERCLIHGAGRREPFLMFVVAVANSDQYGNRAYIAPGAKVNDGALDLIAVSPMGIFSALPLVARLFLGNIDRSPHVLRLSDHRFIIERAQAGLIHTDGETHSTGTTIEVCVHPRSLRLVVPENCYVHSPAISRAGESAKLASDRPADLNSVPPSLAGFFPALP